MEITLNFITDSEGNRKSVVISIEDFEKLIEKIEDLEDAVSYLDAKIKDDEYMPLDEAFPEYSKKEEINV